jgi:hypothetical protein
MGTLTVSENVKFASIEAVVIRADGTREDLGTICYYHKSPLKRLAWRVASLLKGKTK